MGLAADAAVLAQLSNVLAAVCLLHDVRRRDGLSKHPKVLDALTTAWRCVLVAAHHHQQKKRRRAEMPKVLDYEQYEIMFRKLYLFAKEETSDAFLIFSNFCVRRCCGGSRG